MKSKLLILLTLFISLSNCSIDNNSTNNPPQVIKIYWNLINVSGGIAGVNEDFQSGTITWTFDEPTETLTIFNNNTNVNIEDGLDSGTYSYSILNVEDKSFLVLDSNELGSIELTTNQLTINENIKSESNVADGFIYLFSRTTITE